ncbi:MAG TPA: hypothetical protein VFC36_00075 [Paludibacter sp.]|nr:hypothetical protein [Paludibacter sp.]
MRKFMVLILVLFLGCTSNSQVESTKYIDQGDYIVLLKDSITKLNCSLVQSWDSIAALNQRTIMTEAQFITLYKYDRLNKYYLICVKNPTQWKYYKGWSIRVFTQ